MTPGIACVFFSRAMLQVLEHREFLSDMHFAVNRSRDFISMILTIGIPLRSLA